MKEVGSNEFPELMAGSAAHVSRFGFEVLHSSSKPGSLARLGRLLTPHGVVDTPAFVAVGTHGVETNYILNATLIAHCPAAQVR